MAKPKAFPNSDGFLFQHVEGLIDRRNNEGVNWKGFPW